MKLNPFLHEAPYAFVQLPKGAEIPMEVVAVFAEAEGTTIVVKKAISEKLGLASAFDAAWITLSAETALDGLGITAAFSSALAKAGISCNVFAPIRHDHIFVPFDKCGRAKEIIETLEI